MPVLQNVVPNWGEDYRGVAGGESVSSDSMPVDASIQVEAMTDAMDGLTSDGSGTFNNSPAYEVIQVDSMQGVVNNALDATLEDEDMYLSVIPGPHANTLPTFDIEYPTGPELQPGENESGESEQ